MSGKKTAVEVHKFGGASLGDGAAFRHAVSIVQGRQGAAPVVVVSAPAGITDVLLGLATRAVAGDTSGLPRDVEALRKRYQTIARDALGEKAGQGGKAGKPGKEATAVAGEIDRSIDELASVLTSLAALKELTPRTRDFVVSRGERLSAQMFAAALAAAGTPSAYIDATDIVFTDGPFGGASPDLALTDAAARKTLQPLIAAGKVPVVPGFIGSAKIEDEKRMRFDGSQFYLKSRDEMAKVFDEIPESIINTQLVAEMCDLAIPVPKGSERYPKYPLPAEIKTDRAGYLRDLCIVGLQKRYGVDYVATKASPAAGDGSRPSSSVNEDGVTAPGTATHVENSNASLAHTLVERLDYELSIINKTGFIDYFLVVWDFIDWAKQHGIPVGPGRGSGAGCLVAYLLGITNLDPLRFKLLFERFLNPERVSPPDFDIDFCMRRRGEVIDYVRQKYGNDCVANIITYGTLGPKMVIRDVARVHNLPYAEADRLAKMIPDELNISLDDSLK